MLFPKHWVAPLLISLAVYSSQGYLRTVHPVNGGLNPFAWQFLMVSVALIGRDYAKRGELRFPRSRWLLGAAIAVLLFGLFYRKQHWLPQVTEMTVPLRLSEWFISKGNWGPIRALHHFALMFVVLRLLPISSPKWDLPALDFLRVMGRHSLVVYCTGVVLSKLCWLFSTSLGTDVASALLLSLNAVMIQVIVAEFVDWLRGRNRTLARSG